MKPNFAWWKFASCNTPEVPVDVFFDGRKESEAKAICAGCPAQLACLEESMQNLVYLINNGAEGDDYGIFGGLTQPERADLLRLIDPNSDSNCYDTVRHMEESA